MMKRSEIGKTTSPPTHSENDPPTRNPGSAHSITLGSHGHDVGQTVHVTWGEETISPVQYNTFRVGPFAASTVVLEGETISSVTLRLWRELDLVAKVIRKEKAEGFFEVLKQVRG